MRLEAKYQLIKDVILAVVGWVVAIIVFSLIGGGFDFSLIFGGLFFAGVPFGWRWMNNIFTAVGIWGIAIKLIASIFLAPIAIFVVIVKDIIFYLAVKKDEESKKDIAEVVSNTQE